MEGADTGIGDEDVDAGEGGDGSCDDLGKESRVVSSCAHHFGTR